MNFASESHTFSDSRTGVRVRQVTNNPTIHHHPFYYLPCMDDAMTRLFFVSHRTGSPEVWCEIRATGELQQLTDQPGLVEWSMHPSHDGRYAYYTSGQAAWRVNTETCKSERMLDFGNLAKREKGMVGAAMGTTTLSHDDRYWAIPVKIGMKFNFIVIDTATGKHTTILEADTIAHPEFHPSDNTLLRYAGSYEQRIWVINRDGTDNRLVYHRKALSKPNQFEWIVHETWRPGSREIITANWPRGCIGIDIDTGATRQVCAFNAWHPSINRQGTQMCADTTFPDIGLQLFDPCVGVGAPRTLCFPDATNEGRHWNTDHCPYDDEEYKLGKWKVYAPQHTHPHPSFSPDGRFVVFTSDRTEYSEVYEVEVTQ
jgi:oligogalacturonide lyase